MTESETKGVNYWLDKAIEYEKMENTVQPSTTPVPEPPRGVKFGVSSEVRSEPRINSPLAPHELLSEFDDGMRVAPAPSRAVKAISQSAPSAGARPPAAGSGSRPMRAWSSASSCSMEAASRRPRWSESARPR